MKYIFSVLDSIEIEKSIFTQLRVQDGRCYYISTDAMQSLLRDVGHTKKEDFNIALSEFANKNSDMESLMEVWFGLTQSSVIDLSVDEVETFLELIEMRDSTDLFLNLGEKNENEDRSIGELIFTNSVVEIIFRGRVSNGKK